MKSIKKEKKEKRLSLLDLPLPPTIDDLPVPSPDIYNEKEISFSNNNYYFVFSLIYLYFIIFIYKIESLLTKFLKDLPKYLNPFTSLVNSKRADIKRFIFIIMFFFMVYALFFSVLPGNERVLTFVCALDDDNVYQCQNNPVACDADNNCDDSAYGQSGTCQDCTYWNVQGAYGDCTGDASCTTSTCCGDDDAEVYSSRVAGTDAIRSTSAADDTCCNAVDCVDATYCFTSGTTDSGDYCNAGTWQGGDDSSAACSGLGDTWLASGGGTNSPCCGDDSGEDWDTGGADAQGCCCDASQIGTGNDVRCASIPDWCIDGDYCTGGIVKDDGLTAGGTDYTLVGDDIVCGCDQTGDKCDNDEDETAEGLCASNTCDIDTVAKDSDASTTYISGCGAGRVGMVIVHKVHVQIQCWLQTQLVQSVVLFQIAVLLVLLTEMKISSVMLLTQEQLV